MNKICLINNFASHYRHAIFKLLDKELDIDFYFGDKAGGIKKMDYSILSNFKAELKNKIIIKPFYWQKGSVNLFFKSYKCYIVSGEYFCISTWVILFLSKFTDKKVYLWTHGWYGNEKYLKKTIKKLFFHMSDGLFLYGNYAKNLMILEGFSEKKMHVVYNSLDYDLQLKIRNNNIKSDVFPNYFKNDNQTIIFTGRLTKEKKLEQLVLAARELKNIDIHVNLVFVGIGSEEEKLKNIMIELGILDYWFYGPCYDETKVGELIYNSSLCVSPGNVGLTAIHSLVYGTPVLTHNDFLNQGPEFEAIKSNLTGDFFVKNDIIDLTKKIHEWLSKTHNRESVRLNCFKIIDDNFNPHYQLKIFESVTKIN